MQPLSVPKSGRLSTENSRYDRRGQPASQGAIQRRCCTTQNQVPEDTPSAPVLNSMDKGLHREDRGQGQPWPPSRQVGSLGSSEDPPEWSSELAPAHLAAVLFAEPPAPLTALKSPCWASGPNRALFCFQDRKHESGKTEKKENKFCHKDKQEGRRGLKLSPGAGRDPPQGAGRCWGSFTASGN